MFGAWQAPRETRFDLRPAIGVVGVAVRQAPQAMQVFGQNHDRQQVERPSAMHRPERRTQIVDVFHQQPTLPFEQIHREEIGATRKSDPKIIRNAGQGANARRAWPSEFRAMRCREVPIRRYGHGVVVMASIAGGPGPTLRREVCRVGVGWAQAHRATIHQPTVRPLPRRGA